MLELVKPTLEEIKTIFESEWGADFIVGCGRFIRSFEVDGYAAKEDGRILGLVTYIIRIDEIEIVTLNSMKENIGIGTLLINKMIETAKQEGIRKLYLITTNDKVNAIQFYQKRKFRISRILPGAVTESRKIKPEIPLYGNNGIEIRDEVELVLVI